MNCEAVTFYNHLWCPKSQSIQLALEASRQPHTVIKITAFDAGHQCNENERLEPALVMKGQSFKNYQEIVELLQLLADDQLTRFKQVRLLQHFVEHILPYFEKSVILSSPREGLDLFIEALSFLENEIINSGGKYFGGTQPSVVDYGLFPYLDKIGKWIPSIEPNECPRIQAWIKVMREHPLVVKTLTQNNVSQYLNSYSESLKGQLAA